MLICSSQKVGAGVWHKQNVLQFMESYSEGLSQILKSEFAINILLFVNVLQDISLMF